MSKVFEIWADKNESVLRDATRSEEILIEKTRIESEEQARLTAEKQFALASAHAKLVALGLTETEIAALVGA